jgi:hypothetical protein
VLGEEPQPVSAANAYAIHVWNLLADRNGSFDWGGLPFVAELLGIADVEALVDALLVIKLHRPAETEAPEPPPPETL